MKYAMDIASPGFLKKKKKKKKTLGVFYDAVPERVPVDVRVPPICEPTSV